MKILFVLKKNNDYGYNHNTAKSGLLYSATLTAESLRKYFCINYKIVIVEDANSIDRALDQYKPDCCIIEALFVTPDKLIEIQKLHKRVAFLIRIHSKIPFLANEGIAVEWLKKYVKIPKVFICFNNRKTTDSFIKIGFKAHFLPNIYNFIESDRCKKYDNKFLIKIGCFGAIRPLKNQLLQAFAAIIYARENKINMEFHINSGRQEQGGESALKNIRNLFKGTPYRLVEHTWHDRENFLAVIRNLDLGMQVSFTESFNIVAADFVSQRVPIIVSKDIDWMPESLQVSSTDLPEIVSKIKTAIRRKETYTRRSLKYLKSYNSQSLKVWATLLDL